MQRIMSQMKEQDKTPGKKKKQLNEVEIDNLQEKEFRIHFRQMMQELRNNGGKD